MGKRFVKMTRFQRWYRPEYQAKSLQSTKVPGADLLAESVIPVRQFGQRRKGTAKETAEHQVGRLAKIIGVALAHVSRNVNTAEFAHSVQAWGGWLSI